MVFTVRITEIKYSLCTGQVQRFVRQEQVAFALIAVFLIIQMAITTSHFSWVWTGIATLYRLDGPRIESRWGEAFSTRPDRPCGTHSLLYNG
jgi:hypothetical protein